LPNNLFFIFKFFTYRNTQTSAVKVHKLAGQQDEKLKLGHQYYLVNPDLLGKNINGNLKEIEAVLESAMVEDY
jgi:hypothetical protein